MGLAGSPAPSTLSRQEGGSLESQLIGIRPFQPSLRDSLPGFNETIRGPWGGSLTRGFQASGWPHRLVMMVKALAGLQPAWGHVEAILCRKK